MIRTQKYRLHPNVSQTAILDLWLRLCCWLYNAALEQRILGWAKIQREVPRDKTDEGAKLFKQKLTRYGQQIQLTELRAADERWAKAPAELLRSALHRLDLAYAAFFRRVSNGDTPGFPRFRAVRRYDSFSTSRAIVRGDRLFIPKLGHVKMNLYRPIRGEIKNVVIRCDATGKWWASLQCDLGEAPPKVPVVYNMAGIDLGLKTLAMLSTGEAVPNPRFSRRSAEILARRQQTLARKQKQSANRERQRQLVAKAHAHIANQRVDHARYYAKQLFERFDALAYEDLSIRALACSMLSKSFADVSWGVLLRCLASKAEEAGKHWVPTDHRATSQLCCGCGKIVAKDLSERGHSCTFCGLTIDRDLNASINVLTRGQRVLELTGVSVEGEVSRVMRQGRSSRCSRMRAAGAGVSSSATR